MEALNADPELMTFGVVIGPYRAMADDESLAQLLDQLAVLWASVRTPQEDTA